MKIVQLLITADCIHIRIETFTLMEAVNAKCHALPFCEGMNYHGIFSRILDVKAHRALNAVQVIVESCLRIYEKRRGNTLQIQNITKPLLKNSF